MLRKALDKHLELSVTLAKHKTLSNLSSCKDNRCRLRHYADVLALLEDHLNYAISIVHSIEMTAMEIGLYLNTDPKSSSA